MLVIGFIGSFFGRGFNSRRLHLKMNIENLFRRHHGANGRYSNVGTSISAKNQDGSRYIGIHFHSDPLTLDRATQILRDQREIRKTETVILLVNCGIDKNGVEGHAALTDTMYKRLQIMQLSSV